MYEFQDYPDAITCPKCHTLPSFTTCSVNGHSIKCNGCGMQLDEPQQSFAKAVTAWNKIASRPADILE